MKIVGISSIMPRPPNTTTACARVPPTSRERSQPAETPTEEIAEVGRDVKGIQ